MGYRTALRINASPLRIQYPNPRMDEAFSREDWTRYLCQHTFHDDFERAPLMRFRSEAIWPLIQYRLTCNEGAVLGRRENRSGTTLHSGSGGWNLHSPEGRDLVPI